MIALHHTASNRFLRVHHGQVNGKGGPMAVNKLPDHWGAERFLAYNPIVDVPPGEAVLLFCPCSYKSIGISPLADASGQTSLEVKPAFYMDTHEEEWLFRVHLVRSPI